MRTSRVGASHPGPVVDHQALDPIHRYPPSNSLIRKHMGMASNRTLSIPTSTAAIKQTGPDVQSVFSPPFAGPSLRRAGSTRRPSGPWSSLRQHP
jgi:hypothetical protein